MVRVILLLSFTHRTMNNDFEVNSYVDVNMKKFYCSGKLTGGQLINTYVLRQHICSYYCNVITNVPIKSMIQEDFEIILTVFT